jgi:hypothetical protein
MVDVFACEDIFSKDFVHLGIKVLRKRFNLCVNRFRALLGSFFNLDVLSNLACKAYSDSKTCSCRNWIILFVNIDDYILPLILLLTLTTLVCKFDKYSAFLFFAEFSSSL